MKLRTMHKSRQMLHAAPRAWRMQVLQVVRALAGRPQDSTTDIQQMIERLQSGVQNAVKAMHSGSAKARHSVEQAASVDGALSAAGESVARINDMTAQIATATCVVHRAQSPPLTLATVDNFPPFSYMDKGRLTGIDVELIHEMARRLDISVRIQAYPWARVMSSVKRGEVDGAFAAFDTQERQRFCLYVGMLHAEEFYLFARKDNEFPYAQISDLYGKRVGIDRGVFVSDAFEQAVAAGRIAREEVNDMGMINIRKLNAGRIDTAFVTSE